MSKLYTIGARQERHDTISALLSAGQRDTMADWRTQIVGLKAHHRASQ